MKTREQMIDELPDILIAAAMVELSYQEWFLDLPRNADQGDAIFTLALEMQEVERLQAAAARTEHLKSIEEYKREAA